MVTPSFVAKVSRAKEHLVDLKDAIDSYADTHPYTVAQRVEGKKQRRVWRLEFTASPANTDIPVIAADVVYNLRSGLDHLICAMVPAKERYSVMFPILFEGVWEAIVPGEDQDRIKQRMRWASVVKTLPNDAVTALKRLQPPDDGGEPQETHGIRLLNRLSNMDRHRKLPLVAGGLAALRAAYTESDGTQRDRWANPATGHTFANHAEIPEIPEDAMNVQIRGVPEVGIQLGDDRLVVLPESFWRIVEDIEDSVFPALLPFVRA